MKLLGPVGGGRDGNEDDRAALPLEPLILVLSRWVLRPVNVLLVLPFKAPDPARRARGPVGGALPVDIQYCQLQPDIFRCALYRLG